MPVSSTVKCKQQYISAERLMVKTKHLQVYHNICMPSLAFSECIYTLQIICSAQKLQNKHVYITWTYAILVIWSFICYSQSCYLLSKITIVSVTVLPLRCSLPSGMTVVFNRTSYLKLGITFVLYPSKWLKSKSSSIQESNVQPLHLLLAMSIQWRKSWRKKVLSGPVSTLHKRIRIDENRVCTA